MPLEYESLADRGMKMKMTAKSITKESVSDSKFEIPSDYKEIKSDDIYKEMKELMRNGGNNHE